MQPRPAQPADNAALRALTAACPMRGELALCVHRDPDFFALNRLEGDRWAVSVVDAPTGEVVGCVAEAERLVYLQGTPARCLYVSDLKVHPAHRGEGGGVADALCRAVQAKWLGQDPKLPVLLTVLAGNAAMQRRVAGPRGLPRLEPAGTLRIHTVPLLRRRREDMVVMRGSARDLDEMAALWGRVAPGRQFAPVYAGDALAAWIAAAPGLSPSDYWLARGRDGRLAGFLALWDQQAFKQLRIEHYSARAAVVRAAFNAAAPLLGAPRLPPAGADLRALTVAHVCVPAGRPGVLRALLAAAGNAARAGGYGLFSIGLDVRDPLSAALRPWLTLATDVHVFVTSPTGGYAGPRLDDRPLHYEIALV